MSNKKQTPVDKLHSRILFNIGLDDNDIKELGRLASECMNYEKERIMEAFDEGQEYEYQYHINSAPKFDSETYYKETYEQ
jgi:hypothetical protein